MTGPFLRLGYALQSSEHIMTCRLQECIACIRLFRLIYVHGAEPYQI